MPKFVVVRIVFISTVTLFWRWCTFRKLEDRAKDVEKRLLALRRKATALQARVDAAQKDLDRLR